MKKLIYSITIQKPSHIVFEKMTDKALYADWAKAWGEGMTYEGEWKEGHHISFMDKSQGGTKVLVEQVIPDEAIKMVHVAMVNTENYEHEITDETMRKWIGTREDYFFKAEGEDATTLEVIMHTDDTFEEMMGAWNQALEYLKQLCEA